MSYDVDVSVSSSVMPPSQTRQSGESRQQFRARQRADLAKSSATLVTRTGVKKDPILTLVALTCPKCNKPRHLKYLGDDGKPLPISSETVDVRGETRMIDVCSVCIEHYMETDRRYVMKNLKKLQEAMRNRMISRDTNDKDFAIDL